MFVALTSQHYLELHHLGVQMAFLHGYLDELYLQQPQFLKIQVIQRMFVDFINLFKALSNLHTDGITNITLFL